MILLLLVWRSNRSICIKSGQIYDEIPKTGLNSGKSDSQATFVINYKVLIMSACVCACLYECGSESFLSFPCKCSADRSNCCKSSACPLALALSTADLLYIIARRYPIILEHRQSVRPSTQFRASFFRSHLTLLQRVKILPQPTFPASRLLWLVLE